MSAHDLLDVDGVHTAAFEDAVLTEATPVRPVNLDLFRLLVFVTVVDRNG